MSKTKDELLSKLNELIEQHGFVVDNEMLNKALKEYSVSLLSNEELISKCKEAYIKVAKYSEKDAGLIAELVGRYRNLIVTEEVILQNAGDEESVSTEKFSNKEDENVKEMTVKTIRGDIPVRVITLDLDSISSKSNVNQDEAIGNIIKSFIDITK